MEVDWTRAWPEYEADTDRLRGSLQLEAGADSLTFSSFCSWSLVFTGLVVELLVNIRSQSSTLNLGMERENYFEHKNICDSYLLSGSV